MSETGNVATVAGEPLSETPSTHRRTSVADELDLLFLGGVFPKDEESAILARSKGPIQNAANALQWTLIRGLDAELGRPVSLLNAVFVGSYPRLYTDLWIGGREWSHAPGAHDRSIPFLNAFGIKHLWRAASMIRSTRSWAAGNIGARRRCILIYSMHMPFMVAAALAKQVDHAIRVCLVVPDLPEYMNISGEGGLVYRVLKTMDQRAIAWALRSIDGFVLLTRHMAKPLGVGSRPWIVMEGAVEADERAQDRGATSPSGDKCVLYAGTLHRAYGIVDLLDAFALVANRECQLWICGAGEAEMEIRERAARDPRIHYFGQVSRAEVLALQRKATAVVNPRSGGGEFTKYSFPSKLLEYLLSGTPAIVRRLAGVPEEYFPYLFVVEGSSPADLARTISEVIAKPPSERAEFGNRARRFVVEQKTGSVQARRILKMIEALGP